MAALSDWDISKLCGNVPNPMIEPFEPIMVRNLPLKEDKRVVSYGLGSYGYDIRLANEFKVFTPVYSTVVDPKNFDERCLVGIEADDFIVIPGNSYILGRSLEYIRMPRHLTAYFVGKSTYARCGISVNVTPIEAGWEGHITVEIANQSPCPAKVYANEGIGQIVFLLGSSVCRTSYADRKGKYQGQKGVTLPTV